MLSRAVAEIDDHDVAARRQAVMNERRRVVCEIDQVLDELEQAHVEGRMLGRSVVRDRADRLSARLGRTAPPSVVGAVDSVRLHDALLDWAEELVRDAWQVGVRAPVPA